MKVEMKAYGTLCSLEVFKINDIKAKQNDFVDKYDHCPESAESYGCGDMRADVIPSTKEVLTKYGISEKEYQEIAEKVSEEISFGRCGWCV